MVIDGFGNNDLVLVFAMFGGITVFGLLRAARYPRSGQVTEWMATHGLDPETRSRQGVARYLKRTRWIRTIGFLVGFNVPFMWMWITRSAYRMNDVFDYWWLIGFAVGILLAEIVRPFPAGSATVMEPRWLAHYLPDFTRVDRWILAGLAILPVVGSVVLPEAESLVPGETGPLRHDLVWYVSLCLSALAIIVVTRLVQEWIVHRRQSFDDLDDLRADDAMRSASIQGLAGLGYGAPMWITATMAWDLVITTNSPATWVFATLGFVLMGGGLGMLLGFPRLNTKWTVPRATQA